MNTRHLACLLVVLCILVLGFLPVARPQNAVPSQPAQRQEESRAPGAPAISLLGVTRPQDSSENLRHATVVDSASSSSQTTSPIFSAPTIYDADGHGNDAVATGDFNGDGKLDLVVANFCEGEPDNGPCATAGTVSVLLGNGDGTFQPAVTYISGGFSSISVAVGDLNGDGKLDLAVVNSCSTNINCPSAGSVSIFLGNGDGTFQAAQTFASGGYQSYFVAMGDFNDDGNLDLAVASLCTNSDCKIGAVSIMLGKGDGTFQPPKVYSSGNYDSSAIAVADFNGDGKLDLAVTNSCNCSKGSLSIFLGNGDGTFQKPKTYMPGAASASPVAVGDFNGDGKADLAEAIQCADTGCADGGVNVLLGNGDGTFQPAQTYASGGGASNYVVTGDFNHDGKLDLAVENPCTFISGVCTVGASASILLGNGDGTFQAPLTYPSVGQVPDWMASGDFNNDGMPDLAIASTCYCNTTDNVVTVFLNIANGSLQTSTTSISSSASSTTYGQSVTLMAVVSSTGSVTPTGTVAFTDSGSILGTVSLTAGVASLTTTSLAAGTQSITASYGGNSDFSPSTSPPLSQTVSQATSTVAFVSSLNPAFFGQSVTFTATITPQYGGTATGTVTFENGSTAIGSGAVIGNSVVFTTSTLPVAASLITAVYSGDGDVAGSSSPTLTQVVHKDPTTTIVTSSANPITVGQSVTFTATVSSSYGVPPNGEIVTFKNGAAILGTAAISSSVATFTTSALPPGADMIKATFPGDATLLASTSNILTETVNNYASTTTIASSANPSMFGQNITFTATVSAVSGGAPGGTVTFKNGTATLGTQNLTGGVAMLSTNVLTVGTHSITAVYNGDATHEGSTSSALSQVVNKATTTASITSSVNPSTFGQSVTFTVTITPSGSGTPTGSVSFKSGTKSLGGVQLASGVATLTTTTLAAGSDVITATYSGSASFLSSSATLTQVVN